jgi:hypothetical protein
VRTAAPKDTLYAPPEHPWTPIDNRPGAGAYLSVYLSSPLARLPVRDVTRLNDNKSDPNLETGTYGLFSTCEPIMRGSIKARGIGEIFFLTTIEDVGRCLVGHYELGWLVEFEKKDVALAATSMRFIDPIPVDRISGKAGARSMARGIAPATISKRFAGSSDSAIRGRAIDTQAGIVLSPFRGTTSRRTLKSPEPPRTNQTRRRRTCGSAERAGPISGTLRG